jgi:hypothetical protein
MEEIFLRFPKRFKLFQDFAALSRNFVTFREDFSRQRPPAFVAQVSKPAVSPTSKSAECPKSCNLRVWKPATQQTWKSALLGLRLGRAKALR